MDDVTKLHRDMARQRFATRSQAVGSGMPNSRFTAEAHRSGWERTSSRGSWVASADGLDHGTLARAHVAAIAQPVLVTGASALFLLGILAHAPALVDLLVPLHRSPAKREGVRIHHTRVFDEVRYQHVAGLLLASVPRAFADYAAHAGYKQLCFAISAALSLRLCTLGQLEREVARRGRFAGRGLLRRAVGEMKGETTHSGYERDARRLLRAEGIVGLPAPLLVWVEGRPEGEIDIPFEDVRFGVEVDGPHHLLAEVASADRARDRRLKRVGWTIDRFFWFELDERPRWFVQEVQRQLHALRTR